MKKVTIDTNCIIGIEEQRSYAPLIQQLIALHHAQKIQLQVPASGASERQPDHTEPTTFTGFQERIQRTGLDGIVLLCPPCYLDISFFDWCICVDDKEIELERQIHQILFAHIPFEYQDFCQAHGIPIQEDHVEGAWRNAKCDVLGLWCHIYYGGDVFITNDRNFHKASKKPHLIDLGANALITPDDIPAYFHDELATLTP